VNEDFRDTASALVAIGRSFYERGWALGTSGNFSAVIGRDPLRLVITPSGVDKGELTAAQILEVGREGSENVSHPQKRYSISR
jgi:methylthioribulose-1-phosphate dehydratase